MARRTAEFVEQEILHDLRTEIEALSDRHPESAAEFIRLIGRVVVTGQRVEALVREIEAIPDDVWNEAVRIGQE